MPVGRSLIFTVMGLVGFMIYHLLVIMQLRYASSLEIAELRHVLLQEMQDLKSVFQNDKYLLTGEKSAKEECSLSALRQLVEEVKPPRGEPNAEDISISCPTQPTQPTQSLASEMCNTHGDQYEIIPCDGEGDLLSYKEAPSVCGFLNAGCKSFSSVFGVYIPVNAENTGLEFSSADKLFVDFVAAHYKDIRYITEIGTRAGLASVYLGIIALIRGTEMHTYDSADKRILPAKMAWQDNMKFVKGNLAALNYNVKDSVSRVHTLAFIDIKEKETAVKTYNEFMSAGSVIIVHDWNAAAWDNTKDSLTLRGWKRVHDHVAETLGSSCRAFYRATKGNS